MIFFSHLSFPQAGVKGKLGRLLGVFEVSFSQDRTKCANCIKSAIFFTLKLANKCRCELHDLLHRCIVIKYTSVSDP